MDEDDVLLCEECGWFGHSDEAADDGPAHPWCCPECSADLDVSE